ncbi:hypothetical protein LTR27_012464 [Elasticomyces elasticus]|nr:hypothetical protein LTR27_012464 [Elasticomyces elasticus]
MRLSFLASTCLLTIGSFAQQTPSSYSPLAPPGLTFLYTSYVECLNRIYTTQGPRGLRTSIPIVGGNFTGPRLSGKILDVGADWGLTDPQTGIFSADTRYNFQTDDGANIFLQTSGPSQKDGSLHLRAIFETGDKDYYWLNNVVAVGVLNQVSSTNTSFLLRIDVWHISTDWNATTFINGTTYPPAVMQMM